MLMFASFGPLPDPGLSSHPGPAPASVVDFEPYIMAGDCGLAKTRPSRRAAERSRPAKTSGRNPFWQRPFVRVFRKRRTRWLVLYPSPLWVLSAFLVTTNIWMIANTRKALNADTRSIDFNETGLVLGTSKWLRSGQPNLFFKHRMEAAAELYHAGKVGRLLVSGIRVTGYNEPLEMKKSLTALGVPEEVILEDFDGARTLDSMKRAKHVFGLERLTIISQANHNYRAVFLARGMGLEVVAFSAEEVAFRYSFRVRLREYLARAKAVLDVVFLKAETRLAPAQQER